MSAKEMFEELGFELDDCYDFEEMAKCLNYQINKEYYNKKISELYAVIENQEKIVRDLQEKIILLKASEPMLELTKEYGEKNTYKSVIEQIKKYMKENKNRYIYQDGLGEDWYFEDLDIYFELNEIIDKIGGNND